MTTDRVIMLTPPGGAAIAVVRLVGAGVGEFLRKHFSRNPRRGRCVHGELRDGERVIDDPVVVLSEDGGFADVNVHGGPWVVRSVLDLARREGFEVVEGGLPLAEEAVDGQSVLEREVLMHLPLARTELGVRVLLSQVEAWGELKRRAAEGKVDGLEIEAMLADRSLTWLLHPPRVAIVGPPNVGKSTLANQLFAQERSIMADLPGTTRDWVGEMANLDGLAVLLVDTPGLRETTDSIEREAIERSGEQVQRADLVVVVLDATIALSGEQAAVLGKFPEAIPVVNKCDRLAMWDVNMVGGIKMVATTGEGVDALRVAIRKTFGCEGMEIQRPRWWTRRQREIVRRAVDDRGMIAEI